MRTVKMSQAGDTEYGTLDIQHPKHHLTTPWKVVIIITLLAALVAIALGAFAIVQHNDEPQIVRRLAVGHSTDEYVTATCPEMSTAIGGICYCNGATVNMHIQPHSWTCLCPTGSEGNTAQVICLSDITDR